MNSNDQNTSHQTERIRGGNHQTRLTQFVQNQQQIMHQGYIDTIKLNENTRILSFNPNGINTWDDIQTTMLTQAFEKYQIDIVMLNETNIKWNPRNLDKIE